MKDNITSQKEIPAAPFYVLTNDSFMSGWGEADSLINTLIFPCESYEQAEIVEDNASARSDQKRVRIVSNKPRLTSGHYYQVKTPDDYGSWYKPGYFRNR